MRTGIARSKSSKNKGTVPRFICDEQLGRLAKWLRLQGFDTLFECPIEDSRLIRLAQSEGRVLLTRDHAVEAKTIWDKVLLIEKSGYGEQLRELQKKIRLPRGALFSRCLDCNRLIEPVAKREVQSRVPAPVYAAYSEFYHCPDCEKIFWRGSHVRNSEERLRRILK
jgi:hypothetical protein